MDNGKGYFSLVEEEKGKAQPPETREVKTRRECQASGTFSEAQGGIFE